MLAAFAAATFAVGVLFLLDGLMPRRQSLASRLAEFDDAALDVHSSSSTLDTYALLLLEWVKRDKLEAYRSDVLVSGSDLQTKAREKAGTGLAGAAIASMGAILFGVVSDPFGLLVTAVIGSVIGYYVPDHELRKVAAERRVEFGRTLTAYITLLSSSISGGGGLTTALSDAAEMGGGWVFDHIRGALADARIEAISPWVTLDRVGQRLQVIPLIELASALTLAGTSGARVTETLVARAHSNREKELAEARAEAEGKSGKLGIPVGLIMMTWVFFIGYPAVKGLVAL